MAVGINPHYVQDLPLAPLNRNQFLALSFLAARQLEWSVFFLSAGGLKAHTGTSIMKWNAEVTIGFTDEDHGYIKSASLGSEMMDWGKNKKQVLQFTDVYERLRLEHSPEEFDAIYEQLVPSMSLPEDDILTNPPSTKEQMGGLFSIFIPSKGFFFTPLLIDINILVFIAMVCTGAGFIDMDIESLLRWGANYTPATLSGQWWRLLTACFLHGGIMHLLGNMYGLMIIGALSESRMGSLRFITAYILCGIAASVCSLWWHDVNLSVGASGAIFGMYGVFLALLTTGLIEKSSRKTLLVSMLIFVALNLSYGVKAGIDNAAHIGGLLSGLLIGYVYYPGLKKPEQQGLKWVALLGLSILILGLSIQVCRKIPNDLPVYDKKMEKFSANEQAAVKVSNWDAGANRDTVLNGLHDIAIPAWRNNLALLEDVSHLKLTDKIRDRNNMLRLYSETRLQQSVLLEKMVSNDAAEYQSQVEELGHKADSVIKVLNAK